MFAEAVRDLYRYNDWATRRILDVAAGVSPEQLLTPGRAGHGSIRDTFVHMMRTQRGWLSWWDGSLPADQAYGLRLNPADYPDVEALRAYWTSLQEQTGTFVDGLADDDLARVYEEPGPNGQTIRFVLSTMMLHVANHGTQHRSEIAAMLTGFDHSPGDLDYIDYVFRHSSA